MKEIKRLREGKGWVGENVVLSYNKMIISTVLTERYEIKVLGYATPCIRNIDDVDMSDMEDKCYHKR